jgi:hypothetical protein
MTETHDGRDAPRALVAQLERELVDAARRAPRLAAHGPRGRARSTGVWWRSPLLAAALVVVAFGAAALAAQQLLLNGAPVTLPRGIPLQPRSGLGVPLPHSSSAITLQVSDPAGGPAWGARFVATTRRFGCLQFGRVVRGELGVIGEDGSFSDDGSFHELPLDYLEGPFPCAPLDARGHAFAGVFMDGTPASAQVVEESCTARGGLTHTSLPVCPARDERLLMAGMAGPLARTVTYADPRGALHTVSTVGPQGAYLIVERAPAKLGPEAGEYEPGPPGSGTIRRIAYANGRFCDTRQELGRTAHACPRVGEEPIIQPGVTAASVASPVTVRLRRKAVRMRYQTQVLPMFVISFRARVPVTSGAAGYLISVSCGRAIQESPVFANVRRGQLVTRDVVRNGCRGTARIRVIYQDDGHTDGLPFNLGGSGLTVGTRTVDVR